MNKSKSWTPGQIVYAVLMSGLLLGYLAVIATYKEPSISAETFRFPMFIWLLRLITAAMAVWLGKLWKDKGFLLLMAYLLLKLIRVAFINPDYVFEQDVGDSILTGFWVFSACYGFARVFSKDQLKCLLNILVTVWTAGMVIYSSIGVYAAWSDQKIYTIGNGSFWGIAEVNWENRLYLSYYVTIAGAVLSSGVIIALCRMACAKRKSNKILFLLSVIPMILAISLTDSRTGHVTLGAGIAVLITLIMLDRFRNGTRLMKWQIWLLVILVAFLVLILTVIGLKQVILLYNRIKYKGLLFSTARAESNEDLLISNRAFLTGDWLNGRPKIWSAAMTAFGQDWLILLYGTSIINPMAVINPLLPPTFTAAHCHNMPLMILLENGLPGFLLIAFFLGIVFARMIRIAFSEGKRITKMVIPVLLSIAVGEMVECFTWLRAGESPILALFFLSIGILTAVGQKEQLHIETEH